jgi:sugar lactone lactonase YvrE
MRFYHSLNIVFILMLLVVALPFTLAQDEELPDLVLAQHTSLHPEGIEWDAANGRFLTGSLAEGTIFEVADDGTVTPFIEDEDFLNTIGIHIDPATERLLVCNSEVAAFNDPEVQGTAQLGIYDLNSGERLQFVDLGALLPEGRHFCNDVTVDAEGNAYVTDTFSPVIYKVTPEGEASIFVEDDQLGNENGGGNGIDFHPDGYLLVNINGSASLFKIPLDDPTALAQVELSEPFAADGMVLDSAGNLIAKATTFNEDGSMNSELLEVASEDDWASAEILRRAPLDANLAPTTVALRDDVPYVIHAHFSEFFGGQPLDEFEIMRVDFEDAM